jgi:cytidine deaminase
MKTYPLTANDLKLIDEAKNKITYLYEDDKHHVGAALQTQSGNIISAVHIEANVERVTVCAEAIAIGSAISNGEKQFDTIVAVRHPYSDEENRELRLVSPCGMCRELISDYSPECFVILDINGELKKTKIDQLIPLKYSREIEQNSQF